MPILEPIYQPIAGKLPSQPVERIPVRRGVLWTGRVLSALAILFLLMDAVMKLVKPAAVVEGTLQLGYPESSIVGIGIVLLISTLLYAMPRTAVLGALLLTGYLGGAVATHVRVADPLFTHVLFPTYLAAFIWGGLYLREPRLRLLLPLRSGGGQ
ncbi:MAG TPA: DoxX family protein [Longimicrobiaceae bacterium]|nr:DoxX family protein [Longimicrobiaceae bacterium]